MLSEKSIRKRLERCLNDLDRHAHARACSDTFRAKARELAEFAFRAFLELSPDYDLDRVYLPFRGLRAPGAEVEGDEDDERKRRLREQQLLILNVSREVKRARERYRAGGARTLRAAARDLQRGLRQLRIDVTEKSMAAGLRNPRWWPTKIYHGRHRDVAISAVFVCQILKKTGCFNEYDGAHGERRLAGRITQAQRRHNIER
jgi:hypothetical protein